MASWINDLQKFKYIGAVFLDYRRAFETIDRFILIEKLKKIGIKGHVLDWFNSYLTERLQKVRFGDSVSEELPVNHGVPQGSVLGPILFIFYINDIVDSVKKCKIQMFADDTLIYMSSNNCEDLCKILNEDLLNIDRWLKFNSMSLNPTKTKYMIVTNRNVNVDETYSIKVDNVEIERVNSIKYLGVYIDSHLTFRMHAEYIV